MNTRSTRPTSRRRRWAPSGRVVIAALALGAVGTLALAASATSTSGYSNNGLNSSTNSGSDSGSAKDTGIDVHDSPGTTSGGPAILQTAESPEQAAQGYMDALVIGDYNSASGWVAAEQQDIVKALGLGRGPGTLPTMSGSVRVGNVVPTGTNTAYAAMVGTMCRTAPAEGSGAAPKRECVSNEDPATSLPYFTVQLIDTAQAGWKVHFPPTAS